MKRVAILLGGLVFALCSARSVEAVVYEYDLKPTDLTVSGTTSIIVAGNTGGQSQPIGLGDSAPVGWESGSFVTNIDGAIHKYSQLYITLPLAFQTSVALTIGDLKNITYYTNQLTLNNLDWALRIYTKPVEGVSTWYQYRFDAINPKQTVANAWNQWDANTPGWFATVNDRSNGGNVNTVINQSLSEIAVDYASAEILYFSLFAGSSTNIKPLANALDGIVITLANNDEVRLNLVPEPGSMALLVLGGACILIGYRRMVTMGAAASQA